MIIFRSIHVAANGIIWYFFMSKQYSIACMHHFFNHSALRDIWVAFCLGYCKQCCYEHRGVCILSRNVCSRLGLLDHKVALFLVFKRTLHTASPQWAMPIYIPTNSVGGFPFLHTLSSIYLLQIFKIMVILTGVM